MKAAQSYIIPFAGLQPGTHLYRYGIDKNFFIDREYSPLKDVKAEVTLELQKQPTVLVLNFTICGVAKVLCDRCMEEFELPLNGTNRVLVKFGAQALEESDEIIQIPASDTELDVSQLIYEFITLLVPFRVVHPEPVKGRSGCNKKTLAVLESLQPGEQKPDNRQDPRWEALKKIQFNH